MLRKIKNLLDPVGKGHYKAITKEHALNTLLEKYVVPDSPDLERLELRLEKGRMHIYGIVPQQSGWQRKIGKIAFKLHLLKEEIGDHEIFFHIKEFRVDSTSVATNYAKWIAKFSNVIHERILSGICASHTPFYMVEPMKSLRFDLNDILRQIPSEASLLGNIRILNVGFEKQQMVWYLESNIILRSLIDYVGSRYVQVEKIDEDADAIKLLTELSLLDFSQ